MNQQGPLIMDLKGKVHPKIQPGALHFSEVTKSLSKNLFQKVSPNHQFLTLLLLLIIIITIIMNYDVCLCL